MRPFLSTFPSSLPSLQIAKTAAPFLLPQSSLISRPPLSSTSSAPKRGSLSGNLNHPFPSYEEGPFSSQPLFSSCPIQAKASAEGQGGGGGRRRREKRSWFWSSSSSSSSSTAPLQPPSLHRPSTMEKLFFASHPSSVPYLLLLLLLFPFFPPCPLLLPFSIFPAKWERKITVLAGGGGCKKKVSPPPHSIAPSWEKPTRSFSGPSPPSIPSNALTSISRAGGKKKLK